MHTKLYILFSFILTLICHANNEWESDYPLIAGNYDVIGKQCETGNMFTGTIIITEAKPNIFVVTRTINGKKITGSGKVELVTPDKIQVFRIQFIEDGINIEGSFMVRSDLDNDGRISGYVYPKGYRGAKPGLEALFAIKQIQVEARQQVKSNKKEKSN